MHIILKIAATRRFTRQNPRIPRPDPRATVIPLDNPPKNETAALIPHFRGRNEAFRAATSLNMANKLLQIGLIGRRSRDASIMPICSSFYAILTKIASQPKGLPDTSF